jgi:hypothetical protein
VTETTSFVKFTPVFGVNLLTIFGKLDRFIIVHYFSHCTRMVSPPKNLFQNVFIGLVQVVNVLNFYIFGGCNLKQAFVSETMAYFDN